MTRGEAETVEAGETQNALWGTVSSPDPADLFFTYIPGGPELGSLCDFSPFWRRKLRQDSTKC